MIGTILTIQPVIAVAGLDLVGARAGMDVVGLVRAVEKVVAIGAVQTQRRGVNRCAVLIIVGVIGQVTCAALGIRRIRGFSLLSFRLCPIRGRHQAVRKQPRRHQSEQTHQFQHDTTPA